MGYIKLKPGIKHRRQLLNSKLGPSGPWINKSNVSARTSRHFKVTRSKMEQSQRWMGVFSDFAETSAHSKAKLDGRPR